MMPESTRSSPRVLGAQERAGEVTHILGGNAFMAELHSRIVPVVVDEPTFWARYFFHLHQLTQQEQQVGSGGEAGRTDAQPTSEEASVPQEAPTLDTADTEPSAAEPPPGDAAPETAPVSPAAQQQQPEHQQASFGGHTSAGSVSSSGGRDDESNTSSSWTEVEEPRAVAVVSGQAEPAEIPPAAAAPDPPAVDPPADSTPASEPATPQGSGVKNNAAEGDTPSPSPWPKGATAADEDDDLDEDWGLS